MLKPFDRDEPDAEVDNHAALKSVYAYDESELEALMKYSQRAEDLRNYLELNEQEVRSSMQTSDWLHIYSSALTHYDMDLSSVFRMNTISTKVESPNGMTTANQYLSEMQNKFGGDRNLSWE